MMNQGEIRLQLLNGPLDGMVITLTEEAVWGDGVAGPLNFPWDGELGVPQARFFRKDGNWFLEGYSALHGTYRLLNGGEKIQQPILLGLGDILKASETWLLVQRIGTDDTGGD